MESGLFPMAHIFGGPTNYAVLEFKVASFPSTKRNRLGFYCHSCSLPPSLTTLGSIHNTCNK